MEIINRYVYAVGRWLPRKQKKDIQHELESSIYDAMEAKFGKKDEYSEEEAAEIIKELGSPWNIAAGYSKLNEHLIGPELLPIYYTLVAIFSGAVTLGLLVSFVVSLLNPELTFKMFALELLELIPSVLIAVACVVGFTTIIFTFIEKNVPGYRLKPVMTSRKSRAGWTIETSSWSPKELPSVPKKRQKVSLWEPIVGICFAVIAIVLFNFFRDKLGIYYTPEWGSGWNFVPIFSENAIKSFLPFWNTVWGLSIIFNILLLIKGRWTLSLRIFDIIKSFIDIAVLAMMIRGAELIDMRLLLSYSKPDVAGALTPVAEFLNYSIDLFLILALVGTALGILGKIVSVFRFKADTYVAIEKKS